MSCTIYSNVMVAACWNPLLYTFLYTNSLGLFATTLHYGGANKF